MVSDEYVRMCKEATEIQEAWEPEVGHIIHRNSGIGPAIDVVNHNDNIKHVIIPGWFKQYFWLPRQEDLQEIILKNNKFHAEAPSYYKHTRLLDTFFMWWSKLVLIEEAEGITILWLKLLMELLYNKRWDGNGWVKQ